jgi:hemerythrin
MLLGVFTIVLLIRIEQILSYQVVPCCFAITVRQCTFASLQSVLPHCIEVNMCPALKKVKHLYEEDEKEEIKQPLGPDGSENSCNVNVQMRSLSQRYLTDSLPSLVTCLNIHYELKDRLHSSDFHRTFLKGRIHLKRAEQWISSNDFPALKAHKTYHILGLLKAVDEECLEEHETHYKCKGFFKQVIDFLHTEVNQQPLQALSEEETRSFKMWKIVGHTAFSVLKYPKKNDNLSSPAVWKYAMSQMP